jgi:hypothetical protein
MPLQFLMSITLLGVPICFFLVLGNEFQQVSALPTRFKLRQGVLVRVKLFLVQANRRGVLAQRLLVSLDRGFKLLEFGPGSREFVLPRGYVVAPEPHFTFPQPVILMHFEMDLRCHGKASYSISLVDVTCLLAAYSSG